MVLREQPEQCAGHLPLGRPRARQLAKCFDALTLEVGLVATTQVSVRLPPCRESAARLRTPASLTRSSGRPKHNPATRTGREAATLRNHGQVRSHGCQPVRFGALFAGPFSPIRANVAPELSDLQTRAHSEQPNVTIWGLGSGRGLPLGWCVGLVGVGGLVVRCLARGTAEDRA